MVRDILILAGFLSYHVVNAAAVFPNSTTSAHSASSAASSSSTILSTTSSTPSKGTTSSIPPGQTGIAALGFDAGGIDENGISCGIGQDCTRSGQPEYDYWSTNYINPYTQSGDAQASSCGAVWSSGLAHWLATAPIILAYTEWVAPSGQTPTSTDTLTNKITWSGSSTVSTITEIDTRVFIPETSAHLVYSYATPFAFTASSPCCSSCSLFGDEVQIFHWPTAAPSPAVSRLVNTADNFTFTSPSIYVAFKSLYATNLCGTLDSKAYQTTLAFAPGELSTAPGWKWNYTNVPPFENTVFTKATWVDAESCSWITTTLANTFATWTLQEDMEDPVSFTGSYNPCSPVLSIPTQLYTLNPHWTGCVPGISGFWDPPYTLEAGSGLVTPFAPAATSTAITTSSATPGPTIPSITPSVTTTAASEQPTQVNQIPAKSSTTSDPSPTPSVATETVQPLPATSVSADPPTQPSPDVPLPSPKSDFVPSQPTSTSATEPSPAANNPPTQNSPGNNSPTLDPSPNNHSPSTTGVNSSPIITASFVNPAAPPSDPHASPSSPYPSPSSSLSPTTANPAAAPVVTSLSAPPLTLTLPDTTLTADPSSPSAFILASQTLTPGGRINLSDTLISLASNGASIQIGTSIQHLITPTYLIGSQTLAPAGPPVTLSGITYSLDPAGNSVVVGSSTLPIDSLLGNSNEGGAISTAPAGAKYAVAGQTLQAGGPAITISGTQWSLRPGGSSVVIGSSTQAISALMVAATTKAEVFVAGQTIAAGGAGVMVSGEVWSLQAGGENVIIGGSRTVAVSNLAGVSTENGNGVGGMIATIGGFGAGGRETSPSSYVQYTGPLETGAGTSVYNGTMFLGSAGRKITRSVWCMGLVIGVGVLVVYLL